MPELSENYVDEALARVQAAGEDGVREEFESEVGAEKPEAGSVVGAVWGWTKRLPRNIGMGAFRAILNTAETIDDIAESGAEMLEAGAAKARTERVTGLANLVAEMHRVTPERLEGLDEHERAVAERIAAQTQAQAEGSEEHAASLPRVDPVPPLRTLFPGVFESAHQFAAEVEANNTVADDITQGIAQFMVPFTAYLKAFGGIKGAATMTKIARLVGAEAMTAGTAFEPDEARVADLFEMGRQMENGFGEVLQKISPDGSLVNAYIDYMTSREDESEWEGRFKNAVDSIVTTAGMAGVLKGAAVGLKTARQGAAEFLTMPPRTPYSQRGVFGGFRQAADPPEIKPGDPWMWGADGRPRFEIDDSQAMFAERPNIGKTIEGETSLGRALVHPELFRQYPQLKDIKLIVTDLGEGLNGEYVPAFNQIRLNNKLTPEEKLSTLMHEVQHAVQAIEGFAFGGSPKRIKEAILSQLPDGSHVAAALRFKRNPDAARQEIARLPAEDQSEIMTLASSLTEGELVRDLQFIQAAQDPQVMFQRYRRLMGEVEARNVEARLKMTPEERAMMEPELTEDVPRSQQAESAQQYVAEIQAMRSAARAAATTRRAELTRSENNFFRTIHDSENDWQEFVEKVPGAEFRDGELFVPESSLDGLVEYIEETVRLEAGQGVRLPPSFYRGNFADRFVSKAKE